LHFSLQVESDYVLEIDFDVEEKIVLLLVVICYDVVAVICC